MVKNIPAMQETHCYPVQSLGKEGPLEKGIPIPVFLPRKSHGERSLEGCSLWGPKESNTTERLIHNTCTLFARPCSIC